MWRLDAGSFISRLMIDLDIDFKNWQKPLIHPLTWREKYANIVALRRAPIMLAGQRHRWFFATRYWNPEPSLLVHPDANEFSNIATANELALRYRILS